MAYNHTEIRAFKGLFLQPNSFQLPDGAMETAKNCVIANDNTINKRRGLPTFYTPGSGTLNNLFNYQNNIIALFDNKIERLDSNASPTVLGGETVSESGRVGRSVEQNNNLYFTSNNGVMKLTSFSSNVAFAGIPPALDLFGELFGSSGFFTTGNQVAYRVLFGLKDANDNLLLGAPSDFLYLANNTGSGRNVRLEFSVPSELSSAGGSYFYRVYRSSLSGGISIDPLSDFRLIVEAEIKFSALVAANRRIVYEDSVDDVFRQEAVELYTNPNSQEGELQANTRPPLCEDMVLYKNHIFYLNCTLRHQLSLNLVSTAALASGSYIEFTQDGGTTNRRYVARGGLGNETDAATCSGTTTITITRTAHGFSNGDVVYVFNAAGGSPNITEGAYSISGVTANTFAITANTGANSTSCRIQGLTDSSGNYMFIFDNTSSVSVQIDRTALGIVRAIDRDPSAVITAKYTSSASDTPGQIFIESKSFSTTAIQVRAQNTSVGGSFSPIIPTSYSTSFQSENFSDPNIIYSSKFGEPEAVPIINQIAVGSRNKRGLRLFSLRDSVVVLKEDGVFRIDGDSTSNFQATIIDSTVFCNAASSAALLNNQVYFLSNQGVCVASSTGVEIISRNIELPITAVLGISTLSSATSGVGYESERLYILTTLAPRETTATEVYVYNTLTNAWTTWDTYFKQAVVGPTDKLFTISLDNKVKKERKLQNKLDFCDESYSITVTSVSSDKLSAVISSPSSVVEQGDIIEKSSVISRIASATFISGSSYQVVFEFQTNLAASDAVTLYKKIVSTIKLAPYHAGQTNRSKQFSQLQVHTRDSSITYLNVYFVNDGFFSSDIITWRSNLISNGSGWGSLPWGSFPWGLDAGINQNYDTQPAPIIRTYVPRESQRTTWIQVVLEHRMAAENMNIQAIGYQVKGYGERTSR